MENHWALCSGSFLFPRSSHGCYPSVSMEIRPLAVHVASQADRKAAEVSTTWLFIRQELWHHPSRKLGPRGSSGSVKDETEDGADEICMKTRLCISQLLLLCAWFKSGQRSFMAGNGWQWLLQCGTVQYVSNYLLISGQTDQDVDAVFFFFFLKGCVH